MKRLLFALVIILTTSALNAQDIYVDDLQLDEKLSSLVYDVQSYPDSYDCARVGDSVIATDPGKDNIRLAGLLIKSFPLYEESDTSLLRLIDEMEALSEANYPNIYYQVANMKANYYLDIKEVTQSFMTVRDFSKKAMKDNNQVAKLLAFLTSGDIFIFRNSLRTAQSCYKQALDLAKEIGARKNILYVYLQYVNSFDLMDMYDSSELYMNEAIDYAKQNLSEDDYVNMQILSLTYGNNREDDQYIRDYDSLSAKYNFLDYISQDDYYWIQSYYNSYSGNYDKALQYCDSIGFGVEGMLARVDLYTHKGDYEKALECRFSADMFNDSVQAVLQNADFAAIEAEFNNADLKLQAKEMEMKQKRTLFLTIAGAVVLIVGFIIFRGIENTRRIKKEKEWMHNEIVRQTAEIKNQNEEIRTQNEEILSKNEEIITQRDNLIKTNNEITSSITYAKRMQEAAVPTADRVKSIFGDCMIMWRPLNIVSGDFYWVNQDAKYKYLAVADCTGHGVPGAFMSMLGIGIISRVTHDTPDMSAGEMLNTFRKYVIYSLNESDQSETKDGMDMGFVKIDIEKHTMEFAGAHRPLIQIRGSELIEHKGDKMPVGIYSILNPFTTQVIDYQEGDWFYMYSDGIQDQFGFNGTRINAKFSHRQLKQFLLDNHTLSTDEQRLKLAAAIDNWRQLPDGSITDQLDDEIIVGFRM